MRVLLITTHLNAGGIAAYTVSLAKGLKKRGHDVFVASSGGQFEEILRREEIRHIPVPIATKSELNPKVAVTAFRLRRFIRRQSIDIIHAQTRVTQIVASMLSHSVPVPFVTTCHGFFRVRFGRKLLGAWGHRAIAISEAVREHLVNDFRLDKSVVELVYNGIPLEEFTPSARGDQKQLKDSLGLGEGPVVGIIARLSPVKGHCYLIEAMQRVIAQVPAARLLIIGQGPAKMTLVSRVNDLHLTDRVHFIDSVMSTAAYLHIMDVFVLPSLQEGLGLSIAEALAMQLPVVASNVGGIYSLIKDNETGLLVPARNADALSAAIIRLLADTSLGARLGREGRKLIEERFSLTSMVAQIETIYKNVVEEYAGA